MREHLNELKEVTGGDKLQDVLTARYLNAINNSIRALANGENIRSGHNIRKKSGDGWVMLAGGKGGQDTYPLPPQPFEMRMETKAGETGLKVRVYPSTLAGGSIVDIGFAEGDDPPYYLNPTEGDLVGGIYVDQTSGLVTSSWLEIVSEYPEDTEDTFYVAIGYVHQDGEQWKVWNYRYGPIDAQICRNWYAAEAPYFGVTWFGVTWS